MIFWATQWLNYCLGFSWFSKTNFWEVVKMLIFLAYFAHTALCYSQDYWLPLFRNIVSVDTSFIFKASLHYTKCNTSTTMHNFILINKWKLLCRLWPLFIIKTASVLLLCNWISGGQECLDDHPRQLFQYCLLFWASFVKQVSWKSFILLIKTAPVLLLCNWICGGQECLDDHPWHLF